jgi:hypothetical protein
MMRTTALFVCAGLSMLGFGASVASADDPYSPVENPISVRVGATFPSNGAERDLQNTWLAAGVDYAFGQTTNVAQPVQGLLYLDYTMSSRHSKLNEYLGVGPGAHVYFRTKNGGTAQPYVAAGVGAYFQRANVTGSSHSNTAFGGKLGAGVDFDRTYFVEGDYTWIGSKVSGVSLDGWALYVGYHF